MAVKIVLLIIFFTVMIGIGIYSRKKATDVNGFVLCRTVWLSFRSGVNVDWNRKCDNRFPACMGYFGKKNPHYDKALAFGDHAGLFWQALWKQADVRGGVCDSIYLFDSVYGFRVQRVV